MSQVSWFAKPWYRVFYWNGLLP